MFSPDQPPCRLGEADGEETGLEVLVRPDVVVETEGDAVDSPPLSTCQSMVTTYSFEKMLRLPEFVGPVALFAVPAVVAAPRLQ